MAKPLYPVVTPVVTESIVTGAPSLPVVTLISSVVTLPVVTPYPPVVTYNQLLDKAWVTRDWSYPR